MSGYAWFHGIAYLCMIIVALEVGLLLTAPLLGIGLGGSSPARSAEVEARLGALRAALERHGARSAFLLARRRRRKD